MVCERCKGRRWIWDHRRTAQRTQLASQTLKTPPSNWRAVSSLLKYPQPLLGGDDDHLTPRLSFKRNVGGDRSAGIYTSFGADDGDAPGYERCTSGHGECD